MAKRESILEKYIKAFVFDKTAETVDLSLQDAISIKPLKRSGSILLATFWANVLQHEKNFPLVSYNYSRIIDKQTGVQKLLLSAENVTFTVNMATGRLTMAGDLIYEWFTRRFKALLDNADPKFYINWKYVPTPSGITIPNEENNKWFDPYTSATEDYLLLVSKKNVVDVRLEKRIVDHTSGIIPGLGNIALDKPFWCGSELAAKMEECRHGGAVKDGLTFTHQLWRSLLNHWLSRPATKVYIVSPELDTGRLFEIADICLVNKTAGGELELVYTAFKSDVARGRNIADVKDEVLSKFKPKHQTWIEYKVLQRVLYPVKRFSAHFIAASSGNKTQLLTMSAGFVAAHFDNECYETVTCTELTTVDFMKRFIDPISVPVVATSS